MNKKITALLAVMLASIFSFVTISEAQTMKSGGLNARQEKIVTIGAFTANGDMQKLKAALNEGLDAGLTVNEIKEILVQLYAYCGFPRSLNAIGAFMGVMEEREKKGIKDEMGKEASPLPANKSRIELGTEIQTRLIGTPATGGYITFTPAIDEFLKGHLFGDIFGRDNLNFQSRELATISALASMEGVNSQLQSHFNIGRNTGLTEGQMKSLISVLETKVGKKEADNASEVLGKVVSTKAGRNSELAPLIIQEQGSFAVGGTVISNSGTFDPYKPTPEGQTFHGDHAYVFYQVPVNARKLPLVLWHGFGQFSKTWETTPDGREGYQNIFLRRGFGVYVIDQPRRGNAGRSTVQTTITPTPDEQVWFNTFRLGVWPNFFPGVQFSRDPEALHQYFRQMTPDTGPIDINVTSDAVTALFNKIGPGILVTHSHSGGMGWRTAIKNRNIRAIVAYEPGSNFIFPNGEVPPPMPSSGGPLEAIGAPLSEFMLLTKIPIIIFYGDNIPEKPMANPGQDQWRVRLVMARLWRDAVNRRGGDVTVVHLPEIGIRGNTHFPFSDLNNLEIADLLSTFLEKKGLN
jgi:alkylhydroperoxidase/carboxymuconolactone decarboxylase family protein YurZ